MFSKKKLAGEFEKAAQKFLKLRSREVLLASLEKDRSDWLAWASEIKTILKHLDTTDAVKFAGLLLLFEQNPDSRFHSDNIKKFLIDKIEFYKYYDFDLENKLAQEQKKSQDIWVSKVLRLFISRSFLGILILVLILGFIGWFYLDRASCLEFVRSVVQPLLKPIN